MDSHCKANATTAGLPYHLLSNSNGEKPHTKKGSKEPVQSAKPCRQNDKVEPLGPFRVKMLSHSIPLAGLVRTQAC